MSSRLPLVSVLLPVHNGHGYLVEAYESICSQSFNELEIIAIDDGSTDSSASILDTLTDPRLRVFHQVNQGLPSTLNKAISLSRGKYLARQDQDDISLPTRIERQVDFLEANPAHGLVGTWASIIHEVERTDRVLGHPSDNLLLQFELLFDNPFVHSSIMIRKSTLDKVGVYSTDRVRQPPEDYELWSRVARDTEVANIPEILHVYREVATSMSRAGPTPFLERVITISAENLAWAAGKHGDYQVALALASLAHAAYERIGTLPRVGRLVGLLLSASDNISDRAGVDRGILRRKAVARLASFIPRYARLLSTGARRRQID